MTPSLVALALAVLCALWDALFGVRQWQGDMPRLRDKARFAVKDRPVAVTSAVLVVASLALDLTGC